MDLPQWTPHAFGACVGIWGDVYPLIGLNNSLLHFLSSSILAREIFLKWSVFMFWHPCLLLQPLLFQSVSAFSIFFGSHTCHVPLHGLRKGCLEHISLPFPSICPSHLQISLTRPNPSVIVTQSKCGFPAIVTIILHLWHNLIHVCPTPHPLHYKLHEG